jgi:hypothetical protein
MTQYESSIFRQEAIRHRYGSRQPDGSHLPVLPRFVSSSVFVYLWIITSVLVTGGIAAWSTPMRARISGVAAVIDTRTVVAFLPAHSRSHLRVGQSLHLSSADGAGPAFNEPIVSIRPEVVSPEIARRRYGLEPGVAQAITGPAAVAIARCESPASHVYRVTVDGGYRPLFSAFPWVGEAFGY